MTIHVASVRPDEDAYFLRIAAEVAARATCARAHVGAVLTLDKQVLATGYNGAVRGQRRGGDTIVAK